MRLERTLVALGLVLAVAGAIVALNGYIYVNVDRGPPMMVSGAIFFGFGLVLAALGFILRELQGISADASKAALLLAKGRNGAVAAEAVASPPPPPAQKSLPPLAPFEPPAAAPIVHAPEPLPAQAVEAQTNPFAPPAEEKPRRPVMPPAPAPRLEALAKPIAPSLSPLSWMIKPNQTEEPAGKSGDDDWLNQAIAAEAGKAARQDSARQDSARHGKVREENGEGPPRPSALDADQALIRAFGLNEPEKDEKPAPSPQPKPEVIGNYEAHGAHYTMYADGSIEAETQHGVYRFASMEELKRFIEGEESGEGGKS